MKILGFQNGHDVSYCVLEDGIPIIHEELERHLRLKEPKGSGLQYALDQLKDIIDDWANLKVKSFENRRSWVRNPNKDKV